MMYKYKVNGLTFESNIVMPLLETDDFKSVVDFTLAYKQLNNIKPGISRINIITDQTIVRVIINDCIEYIIDRSGKYVEVYSTSVHDFIYTVMNIPMSVLMLLKGKILLHACSVLLDYDQCICFCGEKGVGKSTLLSELVREIPFISDDTLAIELLNNDLYCWRSYPYIKMTSENIERLIITCDTIGDIPKKVYEKYLVPPKYFGGIVAPDKVYKLSFMGGLLRYGSNKIILRKIDNHKAVYLFLVQNIVGMRYFDNVLKQMALSQINKMFGIVYDKVYRVVLPDCIADVSRNSKKLIDLIKANINLK